MEGAWSPAGSPRGFRPTDRPMSTSGRSQGLVSSPVLAQVRGTPSLSPHLERRHLCPHQAQGPAGLPSWTSRCGRKPLSFKIREVAGAGAVTSPSEMSKPCLRSSPTSSCRDFCDSLVQNLTFSRDCFSLEVGTRQAEGAVSTRSVGL